MSVYYNEFDLDTAEWLRELIMAGVIADGVIDTRSIEDVRPADLEGFTQCHFFAGIGVWSYALRAAGWPDDRPVWTGSCPCQPFSAAGKGIAFADERHLWPAFHHLIKVRKPECVIGEQVASAAVDAWIDLVHADLEALGYAFGSVPFPSAGVGAPHIRDRNYWVADAASQRPQGRLLQRAGVRQPGGIAPTERSCGDGRVAHAVGPRSPEQRGDWTESARCAESGGVGGLADPQHDGCGGSQGHSPQQSGNGQDFGLSDGGHSLFEGQPAARPTNGHWRDADWLGCRDGKWRPVEPGTFPLVTGATARVVRLRGYGNAINAIAAQTWIEVVMESIK